ncbi:MAG: ATP-binding protein, partial [Candidatus Melainabacteria bacterium]|nr:ATP-binding protein [Candidatus Melainabacteria bacterium]
LEAGTIEIEPENISLSSVLEKSISAVTIFAEQHHVKVESVPTDLRLYADSNRLVQVLVNLLSNAIKFSPPNSVVKLSVNQSQTDVEIAVADSGPGIPPNQAEAIFEAYRQVQGQDVKKGGTGLGLTICKSIIEAHSGQIGVASELGKGSVFWLRLPLTKMEEV